MRDKDLDEEFMALVKQRPNLVLGPNMPDRGVVADIDWLRPSLSPEEFEALQKGNTESAGRATPSGRFRRAIWRR